MMRKSKEYEIEELRQKQRLEEKAREKEELRLQRAPSFKKTFQSS
jgi:hypothetical protein